MDYSKKSVEEIIQEFKNWPDEEFFPYFRHDNLHYTSLIKQSAHLLQVMLDEKPLDEESTRDLLHIIQDSSEGLMNMIYAAADYDKMKRDAKSD